MARRKTVKHYTRVLAHLDFDDMHTMLIAAKINTVEAHVATVRGEPTTARANLRVKQLTTCSGRVTRAPDLVIMTYMRICSCLQRHCLHMWDPQYTHVLRISITK